MNVFRERPHWHALTFEYCLGSVAAWHLVEDLLHGQWKVYAGEFYPWRQLVAMNETHYSILIAIEAVALALYFARVRVGWCAAVIAIVMFVDNLGSYLNHRLLMSLEFFLVSLAPAPARVASYRETKIYWNLDLVRLQLSLVYAAAALHKLNEEFLSGRTLQNLFWMTHHHGMKVYPTWLATLLDQPAVCIVLAWSTIAIELTLAVGLNHRRTVGPCLLLALVFHVAMAALMAYIKIFAALVIGALIVFVPWRLSAAAHFILVRRSNRVGPRGMLRLLWPGYVTERIDEQLDVPWQLVQPDGSRLVGYDAWVELLALTPLTAVPSEILRRRRS